MDVADSFYSVVEGACRDLYIQSLKEIPPDIVAAIRAAAARETREVAKRIFSHYLQSIELGRSQNMIVCQDTGIPIYWVDIGGDLRLDGARLTAAITRGTERATREHPLRSSIVSPIDRPDQHRRTHPDHPFRFHRRIGRARHPVHAERVGLGKHVVP
jgi:tartrate dehydratase alpha subunit/fumarate hydratase class I-like protein